MALKIFWNKIEILNSCSKTRTDKKLSAQDSGIKPGRSINGLLNLYGIGGSLDMKACIWLCNLCMTLLTTNSWSYSDVFFQWLWYFTVPGLPPLESCFTSIPKHSPILLGSQPSISFILTTDYWLCQARHFKHQVSTNFWHSPLSILSHETQNSIFCKTNTE